MSNTQSALTINNTPRCSILTPYRNRLTQKINIPMFKNRSTRFQLDLKLTQAVIDEIVARGKVEISGEPAEADAVLVGEILSFQHLK